jgi:hypothetical protein
MRENSCDSPITYIIDRFEGCYAVCEREGAAGCVNVPRALIDVEAGEGAVIVFDAASGRYLFDGEATDIRAEHVRAMAKKLWK